VLVPVRDGEEYLDEALRSLAEQTHEDLEVVVVDDGSRDASGAIAREWVLRDRRRRHGGGRHRASTPAGGAARGGRGRQLP
jgi:glycosyltransferase involved in cell wall biosynthesis